MANINHTAVSNSSQRTPRKRTIKGVVIPPTLAQAYEQGFVPESTDINPASTRGNVEVHRGTASFVKHSISMECPVTYTQKYEWEKLRLDREGTRFAMKKRMADARPPQKRIIHGVEIPPTMKLLLKAGFTPESSHTELRGRIDNIELFDGVACFSKDGHIWECPVEFPMHYRLDKLRRTSKVASKLTA